MNAVLELLSRHRSIRKFTPTPVDDAVVKELVTVAQCAATSNHVQAYSLIHIKDRVVRQKIAHLAGPQKWVETAPVFLMFCADLSRLEIACHRQGTPAETGWSEQSIVAITDTAMLGQNMMVAAESLGLGGVFIGGIRNDPATVSRLLNLPDQVFPVFGLCLGYPDQNPPTKPRLSVDLILHQETYDTSKTAQGLAAYDEKVNAYYTSRSPKLKDRTWTSGMAELTGQKLRPHMKAFLESRGFFLK